MRPPVPLLDRLRQRTFNTWLWLIAAALALFTLTAVLSNAMAPAGRSVRLGDLGHDFLAFYSAGTLVNRGAPADLYDLDALQQVQRAIAQTAGINDVAPPVAPWWNPPHVALLFAPFAMLSFRGALALWTTLGIGCLLTSAWLLTTFLRDVPDVRRRAWLLPAALLLVAPPVLQALGHGQNTFLSLLLLTLVVVAWRARTPLLAGLACSLLFYKPQLAAIISIAIVATLGWRVLVGLLMGLVPQALAAVTLMPGALGAFVARVPANLQHVQIDQPYLWHRHATLGAFWRFAFQGNGAGATHLWITFLSIASVAIVAAAMIFVWIRLRPVMDDNDEVLDRFVAATVLATPLLMPFFFDYDLLLLMVGATLIGRDMLLHDALPSTRTTGLIGVIAFGWTMVNPPLAEAFGVSLTVPLLVVTFALQVRRCLTKIQIESVSTAITIDLTPREMAAARQAA